MPKLFARFARREHQPHPLGPQAPRHEGQRECGGLIQPLRVIDDAQDRTLLGNFGQEAEHGEAD
jgi:hypothetical protein